MTFLVGSESTTTYSVSAGNRFRLWRCQAVASGDLSGISIYFNTRFLGKVALYADNSGDPGTLLSESTELSGSAGGYAWASASMPSVAIVAGNWYWLAYAIGSTGTVRLLDGWPSSDGRTLSITYSSFVFPNPPTGLSTFTYRSLMAAYGEVAAAGCPRRAMHMRRLM